ncbi:HAD family hydrolase [Caminibacter mediatlanticus TB-2]|uniref:HAD family hydrolase n=1 Tax=Caminibacter mediatlanticus TB-2 TaxID=391592 RepID=A0AAI9AHP7_9BACT|nr:HAD hydrolase family protein [Caminibacter mediatlanticus]EDM24401.1 hypothetical protein CMTB2_02758 [Caminibacter mediatlanticus TB-2]QCT95052.1 HAD family hydrolase [Caminibacter mediatlanticus TB-2]
MIIDIPNFKKVEIKNIVFDYNGTIAIDGQLLDEVKIFLERNNFNIYVITADTYGSVKKELEEFQNVEVVILKTNNHTEEKANFVKKLKNTIAIGNGNNDSLMLQVADIGVCVIGEEGASSKSILNSDIIVKNIKDAIKLIENPKRIIATLRY